MWKQQNIQPAEGEQAMKKSEAENLINQGSKLCGEIYFSNSLRIDGNVKGNIYANDSREQDIIAQSEAEQAAPRTSQLTISETGHVEGEIHVPHVVVYGTVEGNIHADEYVLLAPQAVVTGNIYYQKIQMEIGAQISGNLVCQADVEQAQRAANDGETAAVVPFEESANATL